MAFLRFLTSIATVVAIATSSPALALSVMGTYRDPYGSPLLSMDMDKDSGMLVVSTSKSVAKLNSDLNPGDIISFEFNFSGVNQVVINKDLKSVILCSSVQGRCKVHSLEKLSRELHLNPNQLVPNSLLSNSSSVLLLTSAQSLLFANGFFRSPGNTASVPILSSRSTINLGLLHVSSETASAKYATNLKNLPQAYSVMYKYAFVHKNFAYLVSRISDSRKPIISTRISRLCLDDKSFQSYVEIPLGCGADSAFSAVQTGYFNEIDKTLYLSFTNKHHNDGMSAVCAFKLSNTDQQMDKAISDCYHGDGRQGPAHFQKPRICPKLVSCMIQVFFILLYITGVPVRTPFPTIIPLKSYSFLQM